MVDEQNSIGKAEVRIDGQEATEKTDIPLRILVLGNFTPESPGVQDWSGASRLLNVTTSSFRHVMGQLSPELSLDVPKRIGGKPKELPIKLSLTDMKAFTPDGVVQQVGELAGLLEVRKLLVQVQKRKITAKEFSEQIQQIGVEPEWAARIQRMLDEPQISPKPPAAPPKPAPKPEPEAG